MPQGFCRCLDGVLFFSHALELEYTTRHTEYTAAAAAYSAGHTETHGEERTQEFNDRIARAAAAPVVDRRKC